MNRAVPDCGCARKALRLRRCIRLIGTPLDPGGRAAGPSNNRYRRHGPEHVQGGIVSVSSGFNYTQVDSTYFEKRGLRRYAGVWSLWALGVGAVISGHFSGWNLGLANGWGSMFLATVVIAIMYLGLTFSLAEMSPALPHTGGAYSFARTAMGPWGGFLTGLAENVEYVLTPRRHRLFHQQLHVEHLRHLDRDVAVVVDRVLHPVRGPEHRWRRTLVQGDVDRDPAGTGVPGGVLVQRAARHRLHPMGHECGRGRRGLAGREGSLSAQGFHGCSGLPALCCLAVPGDRAVAVGRRGVRRPCA
jgi:hypothetical protein